MAHKLRDSRGLTLVEMLCAVVILLLLGLMLNTGLQMAVRSYRDVTAQSEVHLLLSSLSDALADDLRYARKVETEADGKLKSYSSDSYGSDTGLIIDNGQVKAVNVKAGGEDQVLASGKRVLPGGVYGNGAYIVQDLSITYETRTGGSFFTVGLQVGQADGTISAGTQFTVLCLNGPAT